MSTNGYVLFGAPSNSPRVSSFTLSPVPVIAPFWEDFDFRSSGTVYYRKSQDDGILNKVAEVIAAENDNFSSYRPTQCVVVTWYEVLPLLFTGNRVSKHVELTNIILLST